MNKCEWKKGLVDGNPENYVKTGLVFYPCELAAFRFKNYGWKWASLGEYKVIKYRDDFYDYCPFCGADIRKPDSAGPLIVKSGETFVTEIDGINYLCINPKHVENHMAIESAIIKQDFKTTGHWKSFLEIVYDYKLEALKPMLIKSNKIAQLVHMPEPDIYHVYFKTLDYYETWHCATNRLATAKELQEHLKE